MDPVLCVCVYVLCVWCPSQLAQYRLQITGGAVLSRRGAMAKSKHATHAVCAGAVEVVCVCVRTCVRAWSRMVKLKSKSMSHKSMSHRYMGLGFSFRPQMPHAREAETNVPA